MRISDWSSDVCSSDLTSVFVPSVTTPVASELVRFTELVRTLRERCPWDREQTHASLTRYVVEETYEVVEAIERSEKRRVGKECVSKVISRWSAYHEKNSNHVIQLQEQTNTIPQ